MVLLMASQKNPEERSVTAQPSPGQASAKPTGGEIYDAGKGSAAASRPSMLPEEASEAPVTEEQAAEIEGLLSAAGEYYERLAETALRLSAQAEEAYVSGRTLIRSHPGATVLGAFAVGIVIGLLSNRE